MSAWVGFSVARSTALPGRPDSVRELAYRDPLADEAHRRAVEEQPHVRRRRPHRRRRRRLDRSASHRQLARSCGQSGILPTAPSPRSAGRRPPAAQPNQQRRIATVNRTPAKIVSAVALCRRRSAAASLSIARNPLRFAHVITAAAVLRRCRPREQPNAQPSGRQQRRRAAADDSSA